VRLIAFSVQNYRRFVERTTIKLHGPLVAVVGPNEAGKSSLLSALARLNVSEPFDRTEYPRRSGGQPTLEWHFALDDDDLQLLSDIPEAAAVRTVTLKRSAESDKRLWSFGPTAPSRNIATRAALHANLLENEEELGAYLSPDGAERGLTSEILAAGVLLSSVHEPNLTADQIQQLDDLEDAVEEAIEDQPQEDTAEQPVETPAVLTSTLRAVKLARTSEKAEPPEKRARAALVNRVPKVELFAQEDRDLQSSYDLEDHAVSPPPALMHLASLAELDLSALLAEAQEGLIADVGTRRNAANRVLLERFDQTWNQQGIAVQIEVQGTTLHIQATTPEDSGLSSIDERSDGLRWFAALLAWTHGWGEQPIILADEIETHLHYDAQSDLIDVLAQQQFASKVIFTTHSFGCLPHDLGTGVRAVEQVDAATSRIQNAFWQKGAGFSPLLASMGAAATSLTPTRHALLAEGPSDAILLPTLLRQATGRETIRFQVAPGLASVAAVAVGSLDAEAGRVGFVVDGDHAGEKIRTTLTSNGVSPDRIIALADQGNGEAIELEDLIDPVAYLAAVNSEIQLWTPGAPEMLEADLPSTMRSKAVEAWAVGHDLTPPDKTAVAQAVVDSSIDNQVFDVTRATTLAWIYEKSSTLLQLPH
jgi:energy-coupling factor transporter ATP-binding protein EcfA2